MRKTIFFIVEVFLPVILNSYLRSKYDISMLHGTLIIALFWVGVFLGWMEQYMKDRDER